MGRLALICTWILLLTRLGVVKDLHRIQLHQVIRIFFLTKLLKETTTLLERVWLSSEVSNTGGALHSAHLLHSHCNLALCTMDW